MCTKLQELVCFFAFDAVAHGLSEPSYYGYSGYEALFDAVTGDDPFDELPVELQADIGTVADCENLAEDLHDAWSQTAFILRHTAALPDAADVMEQIKNGGLQ